MAAKGSPEELPAGWSLQFNVLKTGRKIKHYVNSSTGQKFFSKDDFLHYIKAHSPQINQPQTMNSLIKRHSKNYQMLPVKKTTAHPKWLPRGWIVELKIRNGSSTSGRRYKCYVDKSTGYRFYSKPEVFRYLKTVKHKSHTTKQGKSFRSVQDPKKVMVQKCTVEDLPPGWTKELKITINANRTRKDPFYTDTVSGYVFRSRRAVQHYLDTGEISKHAFIPKKRHISDNLIDPSVAPKRKKPEHPAIVRQHSTGKGISNLGSAKLSEPGTSRKGCSVTKMSEPMLSVDPKAVILPEKHSEGNVMSYGAKSKEISTCSRLTMPKAEVPMRNLGQKVDIDDKRLIPNNGSLHVQAQNAVKMAGNVIIRSCRRNGDNNSSLSNNNRGLTFPRRSSRRLAGLDPELVVVIADLQSSDAGKTTNVDKNSSDVCNANLETSGKRRGRMAITKPVLFQMHPKNNVISACAKTNQSTLPQSEVSKRNKDEKADHGNELILNINPRDQKYLESGMKRHHRRHDNGLSVSNNKKGLNLPHRFSRRLAGLEPELVQATTNLQYSDAGELTDAEKVSSDVGHAAFSRAECSREGEDKIATSEPMLFVHLPGGIPLCSDAAPVERPVMSQSMLPEAQLSNRNQYKVIYDDKKLAFNNGADIVQEQISFDSGMKRSCTINDQHKSSNPNKKKGHSLPCFSSKRLALKPKSVPAALSHLHTVQNATHCHERIPVTGLSSDFVDDAFQQPRVKPRTELLEISSSDANNLLFRQPSNKSNYSLHDQISFKELQKLETDKAKDDKLEPGHTPPFEEFWSDPCLAFAFKTLTGAIPIEKALADAIPGENAVESVGVSTPAAHSMGENNLLVDSIEKTSNEKIVYENNLLAKSIEKCGDTKILKKPRRPINRKELNLSRRCSKQLFGGEAEPADKTIFVVHALAVANIKAGKTTVKSSLTHCSFLEQDRASQLHQSGAVANAGKTTLHIEPWKEDKEHPHHHTVSEKPCHWLDMEKMNVDEPGSQPFTFGDYWWSESCLEFAFKTLTGTIPIDDNLSTPGYFQQQVGTSQTKREGDLQQQANTFNAQRDVSLALPDIGLPNFFQNDISPHFDTPEKQLLSHSTLASSNPSLLSPGNVSLPSCSYIGSQQPHLYSNKVFMKS
uniref:MBD domain-containing protein n=2 Tax=Rhizophora mucronata TaxID=61149 RepID=A0A2P2LDG6_RHIMU